MKKHKITIVLKLALFVAVLFQIDANAQLEPNYTQYFYNTMSINPAYAGSRGHLSTNLLYRTQWLGLDGAPQSQTLNIHGPSSKHVGIGVTIINDNIGNGTVQKTNFSGAFSYTLSFRNNQHLAFGIKAGGNLTSLDFFKLRRLSEGIPNDLQNVENRFDLNIGTGIYYYNEQFYAGISIPNFLKSEILNESNSVIYVAEEQAHLYFMTGYVFQISRNIKFKPTALFSYVKNLPVGLDISANFLFEEKFRIGAAYRIDASLSALMGFNINDNFLLGLAYDADAFRLGNIGLSNGSLELFLRYEFINRRRKLASPRFF